MIQGCWVSFIPVGPLYFLFGRVSIQFFCSFFKKRFCILSNPYLWRGRLEGLHLGLGEKQPSLLGKGIFGVLWLDNIHVLSVFRCSYGLIASSFFHLDSLWSQSGLVWKILYPLKFSCLADQLVAALKPADSVRLAPGYQGLFFSSYPMPAKMFNFPAGWSRSHQVG